MKRVSIILAVVSASLLAGCAPRYQSQEEEAMTNAGYKTAAMQQALANAQAQYPIQAAQAARASIGGSRELHAQEVSHKHQHASQVSYKQLTSEAEAVINGTIGDGADFLISQGWKANNGTWHKQGYTLTLVVEDGIILNAQLSK